MHKSKMNFNIIALIMLGVSIACIAIGLLFGASTSFYFDETGFHMDQGVTKQYREEKVFSDINSLTIDTSFTEVEVKTGQQNKVIVTGTKENSKPVVTIQDKQLRIQSSKNHRGFTIGFFQVPDRHVKITIYLKPNTTLEKTKIDASFSSVVVEQLLSEQISIESSFGSVEFKAAVDKLTIDSSFGEIKATLDKAERIDVDSSFGDVTLSIHQPKAYYQVQTNSSFGDIQTSDQGTNITGSEAKRGTIVLDNSFGEINLNFIK